MRESVCVCVCVRDRERVMDLGKEGERGGATGVHEKNKEEE